jgi:hypothetical protein
MTERLHTPPRDEFVVSALVSAAWRKSTHSGTAGSCVEAATLGTAIWRKSTHSGTQGNCVEVAVTDQGKWQTSSHSGDAGNCVEVSRNVPDLPGVVAVRDSKNPAGPALAFTSTDWRTFISGVKAGQATLS